MKYEKPQMEIIKFDEYEIFMAASLNAEELGKVGLRGCKSVTWSGRYSNENPNWPIVDCRGVTFGNGKYKDDQTYSVPCKSFS